MVRTPRCPIWEIHDFTSTKTDLSLFYPIISDTLYILNFIYYLFESLACILIIFILFQLPLHIHKGHSQYFIKILTDLVQCLKKLINLLRYDPVPLNLNFVKTFLLALSRF